MRILNVYITREFLLTFVVTLLIFLFVMAVGNIFRVIDLFSRGVSGRLILKVFSCGIPFSLIFAIPMSVLAASFLMFSRMASDREIVALKACGVSLWQVVQPPIIIASLLCLVCIYINCSLAPDSHFMRRKVLGSLGVETPLNLLDEGRFMRDFLGYTIYIGKKSGHKISDIVVYEFGDQGLKQTVRARSGSITTNAVDPRNIDILLKDVRIDQADEAHPNDLSRARRLSAAAYPLTINLSELMSKEIVWKKRADLTLREIFTALYGTTMFVPGDFRDLDGLVRKLQVPADELSAFLVAHLSPETLSLGRAYPGTPPERQALQKALLADFNRLIAGPCLYDVTRFQNVKLVENTRKLLAARLNSENLLRLNRMLLEDAYPGELARNHLTNLNPEDLDVHRMSLMVETSTRLALSFSCYAFVLLGAALGMKIHRKESSIGMAVSLILVFIFYFFIIIADSLAGRPEFQPHLIVWIPFVISEGLGFCLIQRNN